MLYLLANIIFHLERVFPHGSRGYLSLVANLGLVFYLFIVGMELNPKLLISHGRKVSCTDDHYITVLYCMVGIYFIVFVQAACIAIVGMALPFGLGVAISRKMFDTLQPHDQGSFIAFTVFIGTSMSITAFPVLARILKEEGLIYTKGTSNVKV